MIDDASSGRKISRQVRADERVVLHIALIKTKEEMRHKAHSTSDPFCV